MIFDAEEMMSVIEASHVDCFIPPQYNKTNVHISFDTSHISIRISFFSFAAASFVLCFSARVYWGMYVTSFDTKNVNECLYLN